MIFKEKEVFNNENVDLLCKGCNISPLLSSLLLQRNITSVKAARTFLFGKITDFSSPYVFGDMTSVVARINRAFANNEKILIYGDYDCDGVGAIAIIYLCFKDNGKHIEYYIPTRATEGYGLNKDSIKKIHDTVSPDLILTVDCGINAVEEVEYIKELGMDVIVTDHHQPSEVLPECLILNPLCSGTETVYCGAGVAFMLCTALFGLSSSSKYLDICALSTIADIVPLKNDNRLIVKYGLEQIHRGKCRPGIKELIYVSKADMRSLTTGDIGFKIAPRINVAGRLSHAGTSLRLLIDDDATTLHFLADQLNLLNIERQQKNNDIFNEAMEQLKTYDFSHFKIIMLSGKWLEGIVGIVAAKITEYYNLPTILLCENEDGSVLKGSARSITSINLFELFNNNNTDLIGYGGHAMAAGITLPADKFEEIRERFNNYVINTTQESVFVRVQKYDAELPLSKLNQSVFSEIMLLEPFGHENPTPIFLDKGSELKFKQISSSNHIKAKLAIGDLIAFDKLKYIDILNQNQKKLLYSLERNTFNGRVYSQAMLKEFQSEVISIDDNIAFENYCKSFCSLRTAKSSIKRTNGDYPMLYVAYDTENVSRLLEQKKNINIIVYNNAKVDYGNAVVLAPEIDFNYEYYSSIKFLDYYNPQLVEYLRKIGITTITKEIAYNEKPTVDTIRDVYRFFAYNKKVQNYRYHSAIQLYKDFELSEKFKIKDFIASVYVLTEMTLLKTDEEGGIKIINKKVDINASNLLRAL